ncbi:MAG: YdeI/OmpD-associated family protein [Bacteroidota bacterium]|nr:YdeI/OmpD-associated family protein [Bacteroidota bacterium]
MNPKVDWFFDKDTKWKDAYAELRTLVLNSGLTEELKWGCPCYTHNGNNIVLIHGFKEYCALLFMQGALLTDPGKILVQQTENVQSARQIRFKNTEEIINNNSIISAYIKEAIDMDKAGVKVELKKTTEYKMPVEFQKALDAMPDLNKAFHALTPGRQRGYLLYFSSAKQAKTRETRIENAIEPILNGKGLED